MDAEKKCPRCGKIFKPKIGTQKYCGPVCAYEAELERKRRSYGMPKVSERGTKDCAWCGCAFHPVRNFAEKYCSAECRRKARKCQNDSYRAAAASGSRARMKTIGEIAVEARAHGMTYGQYLAWREAHPDDES